MRLVKQDDDNGCGLACVAMGAGTSYAAVRKTYWEVVARKPDQSVKGTTLGELREIMARHGVAIEGRGRWVGFGRTFELDLNHDALVRMNLRNEGTDWHWAIWDGRRGKLLDPRRPSYSRPRLLSTWRLRRITPDQPQEM